MAKDVWEQFCEQFDSAFFECAEKGTAAKMTVGVGEESVTVEVYRTKGQMKKFEDIILKAVKQESGIDLARGPKE
jgi:hypothetical protein